jgi:hypothetical protein
VGVEFLQFKMSTSTAMPPKAIANNLGIGTRQTGAGDDEFKVDSSGWQAPPPGEWTIVSPKKRERASTPPPPTQRTQTTRWKPRPMQGPSLPTSAERKVLALEQREAKRVAAFRSSVAHIATAPEFEKPTYFNSRQVREITPITPISAPAPSKSRTAHAIKRIKDKRRASPKRSPLIQATNAASNFIRAVTKEEAAAPVSPSPASIEISNPFAPLDEPRRGTGAVIVLKKPGSTHLDNHSGRVMTVRTKGYEVISANFCGFFKKTLGSSFTPSSIGFHVSGDALMVHLPEGLVETLGAYLVGKPPSMETYLACQALCRNLCRPIDFETPKLMEDAAIYAPYLAMTMRSHEREMVIRKLQGSVYTRTALKCLKLGALGGLVLAMPVATAATAAGAPVLAAGGLAFGAATVATVSVALAVRSALSWFQTDERVKVQHAPLASVNSTAKSPAQHPDAIVRRLQLDNKCPDATRPDAARVTGIAVAGQAPTVFAKNQDNTVAALQKRSAVLPAPFHPADREEFTVWALKHWPTIVGQWVRLVVPSDPDEWLDYVLAWIRDSNSSLSAKATYERVARELHALGITAHTQLTPNQVYEWTKREASVKLETVLKNADKSPRQILAATPQFVVLTAPFIKQLTGLVRRSWRPSKKQVYAPGVGSKRLADSMTESDWDNMANLDFDGYDSSQGEQIAEMEITICKRHGAPRAHLQLMRGNLETHGVSREGVKFTTPYVRNSGDPWTTLFNTTLNAFLMSYVYCRLHECDPRDMQARFFAGGDDGALFYNGPRIGFTTELARLGLPATVKHVSHLHEIEFLSCRLTHTSTGWNFVPMVGKTIAKLGYSVRAATEHKAKQIARGAAQSMYAASSACPPLRAYLDAVLRVTEGARAIAPNDEPWKMTAQHTGDATDETWAHLWQVYGWDQSLQDTLVARLATIKEAGSIIESPALEVLIDRDTGRADFLFPRLPESDMEEGWVRDLTADGVEPNPGPGRRGPVVVAVRRRQPRRRRVQGAALIVRQAARSRRVGVSRRRNGVVGGRNLTQGSDLRKYMCTLNDPFNCPPVRLGAGCMVPTGVATLFTSINLTVGTGASFVIYPRPWNPILASATATGTTYTYTAGNVFPQLASLQSLANAARVISCGLKVTSTSNATNDSGMLTAGLMPRDNFSPFSLTGTPTVVANANTENGLPFTSTTSATQGAQQFLNYEQTESFAFRKGITVFYKPQDPTDFQFRNFGFMADFNPGSVRSEDMQMSEPFFVVGAVGTASGSTMLVELVLHVEYTTGPFVNSIVNTGQGTLTPSSLTAAARAVFGAVTNVAKEGISAGFNAAVTAYAGPVAGSIAGTITGAAGNIANRIGNYFASTDISANTALVPTGRRGGNFNVASLMEVD